MWRKIRHKIVEFLYGKRWHYWGSDSDPYIKFDLQEGRPFGTAAARGLCYVLCKKHPGKESLTATIENFEIEGELKGSFEITIKKIL